MATIQLSQETEESISKLKNHPDETDEECISRIFSIVQEDDTLTEEDMRDIECSIRDIENGNYVTPEQMLKSMK